MKLLAFRHHYFKDIWNVFDLIVVLASVVGLILSTLPSIKFPVSPAIIRIIRVFRVIRILRLLRHARGMRRLLMSLVASIPALLNIAALLIVFSFMFAIIGMTLFRNVKYQGIIDATLNFRTFSKTSIILFQLTTATGWSDFHQALSIQPPKCQTNETSIIPTGNCGSPVIATIFLISYLIVAWFILLNLFVAVILNNYQDCVDADSANISNEDIQSFFETWAKYDPKATQFIHYNMLSALLNDLNEPFGSPIPNTYVCINLNLPIYDETKIHCLDLIRGLIDKIMKDVIGEISNEFQEEYDLLMEKIGDVFKSKFPKWKADHEQDKKSSALFSDHAKSVILLRASFQHWKQQTIKLQGTIINSSIK